MNMMYIKLGSYQRTSEKLLNLNIKPKIFAKFENGRLQIGTKSIHNADQVRIWRLFWRLKQNRDNYDNRRTND
jgi:hypothetical protein